jgi:hypothetical protein
MTTGTRLANRPLSLAAQQSSTSDCAGSAQRYAGLAVSRIVDAHYYY